MKLLKNTCLVALVALWISACGSNGTEHVSSNKEKLKDLSTEEAKKGNYKGLPGTYKFDNMGNKSCEMQIVIEDPGAGELQGEWAYDLKAGASKILKFKGKLKGNSDDLIFSFKVENGKLIEGMFHKNEKGKYVLSFPLENNPSIENLICSKERYLLFVQG